MKGDTITSNELYAAEKESGTMEEQVLNNFLLQVNKLTFNQTFLNNAFARISKLNASVILGTFALLIGGAYLVYELQGDFEQFNLQRMGSAIGLSFMILAGALLAFKLCFFI